MSRKCACPCGQPLPPGVRADRKYIDHRHAQRAHRARVKKAAEAAGLPASLSLATIRAATGTGAHNGDGPDAAPVRVRRRKPELRVSYRKAVAALADHFEQTAWSEEGPIGEAERVLAQALSPKQREALSTDGREHR